MPDYLGDFAATAVSVQHKFMTVNASGKPTTLGDSPSLVLYVNATTTGIASGVSGTFDFDGRTGLNHVRVLVTTSVTGVTSGTECCIVIATGSVSGVSLNGYPVCAYSLMNRPVQGVATNVGAVVTAANTNIGAIVTAVNTITPARVTAQGIDIGAIVTAFNTIAPANVTAISTIAPARVTAQGIDIGAIVTAVSTIVPARVTAQGIDVGAIVTAANTNVGAVVTAVNTVTPARVTAQGIDVGAIVTAVNTIAPARVTAIANGIITFNSFAAGAIDANALAADAVTEIQSGLATSAALATAQTDLDDIQLRIPAALVGGRMNSNISAVAGVTVTGFGTTGNTWGP